MNMLGVPKYTVNTDATKDLKALELEVRDAAMEVMDTLDYEGDNSEV
jgi:hypothetical protein